MFMDRVGRKPLMLFGVMGCGVCLVIEAAIVATYAEEGTNKPALAAGVGESFVASTNSFDTYLFLQPCFICS